MSARLSWQNYALKIAEVASERSEDPYLKVGSCALRHDNSVAGVGYNGAPQGIEIDWSNRGERRLRVVHAEVNALRYTTPGECYFLASTYLPCNECMRMIASYGIKKVIYKHLYHKDVSSLTLAGEFNIELIDG
jgi:dCMP deaminase